MTPDDFDKVLNTEPKSLDAEFLAAKRGDLSLARKAAQAEAFEQKLEQALLVPVDSAAADRIMAAVGARSPAWRSWPVSLAVAATVAVAVSLAVLLPKTTSPIGDPMLAAFYEHMTHEEPGALTSVTPVPVDRAAQALAQFGAREGNASLAVTYVYPCPIDDRAGLHVVMTDAEAHRTTVLFSPGGRLGVDADMEAPDGSPARAFNVEGGSVLVVFHDNQPVDETVNMIFGGTGGFLAGSL